MKIAGGRVLDTSSPLLLLPRLQLMMVMTIHIAVDWNRWVEPIAPQYSPLGRFSQGPADGTIDENGTQQGAAVSRSLNNPGRHITNNQPYKLAGVAALAI